MNLFTVGLHFLVLLLCKVVNGGWTDVNVPLEAEIIPPGQDDKCQCGQVNEAEAEFANSRIIGGTKTPPNRFPWLAGLYYKSNRNEEWRHGCGGSLISSKHILTAGHCVEEVGPGQVSILLGGHSRKYQSQNLRTVLNITRHENYHKEIFYKVLKEWPDEIVLAKRKFILENDFAILTLENKVRSLE